MGEVSMDRGRVGEYKGNKEMDRCPLHPAGNCKTLLWLLYPWAVCISVW
jgi:hypothetical protein